MKKFKIQVASDIHRDGLGIELIDGANNIYAEVFRCDRDNSLVLNTFNNDISVYLIESMLEHAKNNLDPFEDGTALSAASNMEVIIEE